RHARNRLPAAGVNHPPINLLSPFRIGDGDVNIGGLRGFTDLDHLRLGFTGRIRVKDEWIEFATRNNTGRTGTLRIAYADYIATFRQPIDAILTAIISLVYVVAQDVKEGCLGRLFASTLLSLSLSSITGRPCESVTRPAITPPRLISR